MTPEHAAQLKRAIDNNDLARVNSLMTSMPELHRAPLGYGEDGPLTWVAECRVPWEPPVPARLEMAAWMIANGSDVHQGGDGPLMRAALNSYRIPMMEVLVANGADVNARWNGDFPIVFAACEGMAAEALEWLLDHGADANCRNSEGTALDYLIACYGRSTERLSACIDALLVAGGVTRYDAPGVLPLLRGRLHELAGLLESNPELIARRFPELHDCSMSGGRRLTLRHATLLHVAAEFGFTDAARLLLDRGADVDARSTVDAADGFGGQTAIFHAAAQFDDFGLPVLQILVDRGADLAVRARIPGDYEQRDDVFEGTVLGYAVRFGGPETVAYLRQRGAPE